MIPVISTIIAVIVYLMGYFSGKNKEKTKWDKALIQQKEAQESALKRWIEENERLNEEASELRKELNKHRANVSDVVSVLKKASRGGAKIIKAGTSD